MTCRYSKDEEFETWLRDYNCCKLFETQLNQCVGRVWIPLSISLLTILTVMSNVVAIKLDLGISVVFIGISVSVVAFSFLVIIVFTSAIVLDSSQKGIRNKQNFWPRCKYSRKRLKACQPLQIKSGPFKILDKEASRVVLSANVNYTASLLLVF